MWREEAGSVFPCFCCTWRHFRVHTNCFHDIKSVQCSTEAILDLSNITAEDEDHQPLRIGRWSRFLLVLYEAKGKGNGAKEAEDGHAWQ